MRVVCPHCRSKAVISSSTEMTPRVKDLYCQCSNTEHCGSSFVFTLAFKHDLNPPQKTTLQIASTLVANLSKKDKQILKVGLIS